MSALPVTGLRKAAILMVLLGEDAASEIYRICRPDRRGADHAGDRGARLRQSRDALVVLEEFHRLVMTGDYITQGGTEYANKLLVKAFGKEGAGELLRQVSQAAEISGDQARFAAQGRSATAGEVH